MGGGVRNGGDGNGVAEVEGLEGLVDGVGEVGVGDGARSDGEGLREGGLLVKGEGGGIDGGKVVDSAGDDVGGAFDGVGLVIYVGGEEDFGVVETLVGVGDLHLAAGEALGGGAGGIADVDIGGSCEVGLRDGRLGMNGDGGDVVQVAPWCLPKHPG